jgi:pilus assembly protein Flp/PilA
LSERHSADRSGAGSEALIVSTIAAGKHVSYDGCLSDVNYCTLKKTVRNFLTDEAAATGVEYCLIATGIALGILVSVAGIEARINAKFAAINNTLK